jgi:hypothetical protein
MVVVALVGIVARPSPATAAVAGTLTVDIGMNSTLQAPLMVPEAGELLTFTFTLMNTQPLGGLPLTDITVGGAAAHFDPSPDSTDMITSPVPTPAIANLGPQLSTPFTRTAQVSPFDPADPDNDFGIYDFKTLVTYQIGGVTEVTNTIDVFVQINDIPTPEIDPRQAVGALTLLLGGVLVATGWRGA